MNPGNWTWSVEHHEVCRIVDAQTLWGETLYRVWLPTKDAVVRVRAKQLQPLDSLHHALRTSHLTYVAAAARVADALTQDVLLAPIESSVIPLPHQIRTLSRAITNDRVRYLTASSSFSTGR